VAGGSSSDDVILVMSNGAFGGFVPMLLAALEQQSRGR
jgi:hypothetical protein